MKNSRTTRCAKGPAGRREKIYILSTFEKCRSMSYLVTRIFNFFRLNGYPAVEDPFDADTVIIVTCGFDEAREQEALKIINSRAKPFIGHKRVIIAGCLGKISKELSETKGLLIIGPQELEKFDSLFAARVPIKSVLANRFMTGAYDELCYNPDEYYIEICRGCVNNCSYCVIKNATGYVRSKPVEEIISEFRTGLGLGFKKFVLLGDDCGSYGADIGTDLARLLNAVCGSGKADFGLNIHYLEPGALVKLFPRIDKGVFRKIYFVNIPMQTASQRLLGLMNRKYEVGEVLAVIKKMRALNPKMTLISHMIYGFPTETREEFTGSVRLSEYFDRVVYFYYSSRNGTRAKELKGQISGKEKKYRAALLLAEAIKKESIDFGTDKEELLALVFGQKKRLPKGTETDRPSRRS